MITAIQLQIVPGAGLKQETLDKLTEKAAQMGKSPDALLAEIITKAVDDKPRRRRVA